MRSTHRRPTAGAAGLSNRDLANTPGVDAMFTNALLVSWWVLVPLKPDKEDLRGARTVLDAVRAARG